MTEDEIKECRSCKEHSPDWTTVKCCNKCGMPIEEFWKFEDVQLQPTLEQIKAEAKKRYANWPQKQVEFTEGAMFAINKQS